MCKMELEPTNSNDEIFLANKLYHVELYFFEKFEKIIQKCIL